MSGVFTRLRRSLAAPLVLLVGAFVAVPVALYLTFEKADQERQEMLLDSIQAQGRLVAAALEPSLNRGGPTSFTEVEDAVRRFTDGNAQIRLLLRPSSVGGAAGFYLVAAAPRIDSAALDQERRQLIDQGVLDDVAQSCSVRKPNAQRYHDQLGRDEILTSVVPVLTPSGCWTIIFSYPVDNLLGAALATPYWQRVEVQRAFLIYISLAILTVLVFLAVRRSLQRFGRLARTLRLGGKPTRGFAELNEIAELDGVAVEFDRLVSTLGQTAESIRRRAEDNAHAFKTPIAIMRQSLEPLRRALQEDNVRGRRAAEVMEKAVDRLDGLVDDARRLDESVAELLDPPRRRVDVSRLLRQMGRAYQSLAEARGVNLKIEAPDGMAVLGSEELIETAVEAVLDNAIGFTPAGGRVELQMQRNGTRVEIVVSDDGPGVPTEHREKIFERGFSLRPTQSGNGEAHGGIGLWMARRYVQALGGGINAENRSGRGLRVRLDLPLLESASS
jgi:two-component system, OmpR family, sensor histidine kinase ChvG